MSAAPTRAVSAERSTAAAAAERRAVAKATRRVAMPTLVVVGWYWVIYAAVVTAIVVGNDMAGNELTRSILDVQWGGSSRWMAFVLGIIIPPATLRLHVAAGGTRRSLVAGSVRAAVLVGAVVGVVTAVYLVGERALFGAVGMPWELVAGLPGEGIGGRAVRALAEAIVIATYALSGAVLSMGYWRYGIWRGTAFILVSLVPPALVDLATRTGGLAAVVGDRYPFQGATAVTVGLAGAVVALGLAAWLMHAVTRGIQLSPPV